MYRLSVHLRRALLFLGGIRGDVVGDGVYHLFDVRHGDRLRSVADSVHDGLRAAGDLCFGAHPS